MGQCRGCGAEAKRGTEYCSPLCAIGTPAHDTTHNPNHPALIEPDQATQDWADREWTLKLALERAGFTTDEAITYLATMKRNGDAHD